MTYDFNCTGQNRKDLVKALSTITGEDAKYQGAPSFAYRVNRFLIDKNGGLTPDFEVNPGDIEYVLEHLAAAGFVPVNAEVPAATETADNGCSLTVSIAANTLDEIARKNLAALLEVKGALICKALGVNELTVDYSDELATFPWFNEPLNADEAKAYTRFIGALCEMARNQKRITAKEKDVDNEKYAFRCFLLRLGFIGNDYKSERKILLRNLSGNSAFKANATGKEE